MCKDVVGHCSRSSKCCTPAGGSGQAGVPLERISGAEGQEVGVEILVIENAIITGFSEGLRDARRSL